MCFLKWKWVSNVTVSYESRQVLVTEIGATTPPITFPFPQNKAKKKKDKMFTSFPEGEGEVKHSLPASMSDKQK